GAAAQPARTFALAAIAAAFAAPVSAARAETLDIPPFGKVEVVDRVDCTAPGHGFAEYPEGASSVQTVLGKPCRVLGMQAAESSFMKWRLGKGCGVKPNEAYVVVLEYPDDGPRAYILRNGGNHSRRSFVTGQNGTDAWKAKYTDHHVESLKIPQTGQYEKWTALTYPVNKSLDVLDPKEKTKIPVEEEGFDFTVCQFGRDHDPVSTGAAVRSLLLCRVLDENAAGLKVNYPPEPLPRRRLFWREEMSDGPAVEGDDPQVTPPLDWYEQKARTMKILGFNTFSKEMLEFGHNQHWDPDWKAGQPGAKPRGWMWGSSGKAWNVWASVVPMVADKYGFDILPYYEYGGSNGDAPRLGPTLGQQKRTEPLGDRPNYTHISWSEGKLRVDITDPDTLEEFKYILDGTILRFTGQLGKFAGAWLRPRPGEWAVGFGDATRARFAEEANGGRAVSKADLRNDRALYERYVAWWGEKRAAFCEAVRKHLEDGGVKGAIAVLDNDDSESGYGLSGKGGVYTDDRDFWERAGVTDVTDRDDPDILRNHLFLKSLRSPGGDWGGWEWRHASPACDPEHYKDLRNVWISMTFNRLYTVEDPAAFDAFRNGNGTDTLVRHYGLNENMVYKKTGKDESPLVGYAIADVERAGRSCMMAEVAAMAHGDPVNIGYLMGSVFTTGFPMPVREFNQNFLALPALPSRVVERACADPEVTLREIDCRKWGKGRYFALVHTGKTPKRNVAIRFPDGVSGVVACAFGSRAPTPGGVLTMPELRPWQLFALWSPR
ncbi:MAG: hypothetical protein IJ678_06710, partial [Kiritimatiellae bacterium]|nr:hypothetical protein [Kiritimatiellia bacterium]